MAQIMMQFLIGQFKIMEITNWDSQYEIFFRGACKNFDPHLICSSDELHNILKYMNLENCENSSHY